ncbi:MAG TPA: DUF6496 domain-containing protein [Acidobacteriaceae bacterium]
MATGKKAAKKASGGRKYSAEASASVEREMKAMKQGKLRSGTGAKVTNPKQAIAIGLSEARREGAEAPVPAGSAGAKKAPAKKAAAKKTTASKAPAKKAPAKKASTKKRAAKQGS